MSRWPSSDPAGKAILAASTSPTPETSRTGRSPGPAKLFMVTLCAISAAFAALQADDKDAARRVSGARPPGLAQLDPKRWATNGQLSEVIGGRLTNALDQVELIRRKMDANDGGVRGAIRAIRPQVMRTPTPNTRRV